MSSLGGGGSSGPTPQQQQLETMQAVTNANLNIEENEQRKAILNAMQGTRVFRGSALSRSLAGNTPGSAAGNPAPGPSFAQVSNLRASPFIRGQTSLFDVGSTVTASTAAAPSVGGGYVGGTGAGGARGGSGRGLPP